MNGNLTGLGALVMLLMGGGAAQHSTGPNPAVVYTPPEQSGLVGVRAFPGASDVCQIIGENDLTRLYLDDKARLVGCPSHELGAINKLTAGGAETLGKVGAWELLSVRAAYQP